MNIQATLVQKRDALVGFFRSRGFSADLAEDLVQETVYKALGQQKNGNSIENVEGWLFTIARNVAIDHARRSAYRTTESLSDELDPGEEPDPIDATCRCVVDIIDSLPEDQARLIRLVDLEQTPQTIAAAELDVSRSTLKVQVFRARKHLRELLENTCGACASGSHCLDCSC